MTSAFVAFPAILLRLLAEVLLGLLGLRLVRIDRVGGLALAGAASLVAVGEIALPAVGFGGIYVAATQAVTQASTPGAGLPDGPWVWVFVLGWFVLENLGPLGHAVLFGCALVALARLMARVPVEQWDQRQERD